MTTAARSETLVVGGINVPIPTFFPAVSSVKSNVRPLDDLIILRSIKYPQFLISAYDIHHADSAHRHRIHVLLRDALRGGQIVLLDSGNYEAFWRDREKFWSSRRLVTVSRSTPSHLAFAFDELRAKGTSRGLAKRVESAVLRASRASRHATILPIVHAPNSLLPATVAEVARRLRPILIAVPERELGEDLFQRAATVARIRRHLDRLGHYFCLHSLGAGNPLSILVYAMVGADSFDGLEWCRTAVDYETARLSHLSQWVMFDRQSGLNLKAFPYRAGALVHNLGFYSQWMDRIRWAIRTHQELGFPSKYMPQPAMGRIRSLMPSRRK